MRRRGWARRGEEMRRGMGADTRPEAAMGDDRAAWVGEVRRSGRRTVRGVGGVDGPEEM